MGALKVLTWTLCAVSIGAFGWGMVFFFERPTGNVRLTRAVAGLGLVFAGWHLWALAVSTTSGWRMLLAGGLYAVSLSLFFSGVRACGKKPPAAIFEPNAPHCLLLKGPYGLIRHPFYAAYILFWFAGWLASSSHVALVSVVLMSATYIRAATEEEARFRTSPFATAHANYCRTTGFFGSAVGAQKRTSPRSLTFVNPQLV